MAYKYRDNIQTNTSSFWGSTLSCFLFIGVTYMYIFVEYQKETLIKNNTLLE